MSNHLCLFLFLVLLFISCGTPDTKILSEKVHSDSIQTDSIVSVKTVPPPPKIKDSLPTEKPSKKLDSLAKVVHLIVPLCDNENQGIVPVSKSLGDGFNLTTNLYWGALYGIKTHFKKSKNWVLVNSTKNVNSDILERVIFKRSFPSGRKVYIVADAYAGDKMKSAMLTFFNEMAGNQKLHLQETELNLGLKRDADLIILNGHNGLMDHMIDPIPSSSTTKKDVSVIGCVSYDYFKDHIKLGGGYPLLMTTNLMAPEAYVCEALINSWATGKNNKEIHHDVASAYNKYQKCGYKGASRLFVSGWQE